MGGYEHLLAILEMLKESLKNDYKYVHIISGEDFPIKTTEEIYKFFDKNNKIYADYKLANNEKGLSRRYKCYWPYVKYLLDYKKWYVRYLNILYVAIQQLCPILNKRKIGDVSDIYWGFVWGSYPKDSIEYVLDYLNKNSNFLKDLKTCKIPEEFCFQTILMNSKFKTRMVNDNLRYWSFKGGDGSGPVYLKDDDLPLIKETNAIFARKVKYASNIQKELCRILEQDTRGKIDENRN